MPHNRSVSNDVVTFAKKLAALTGGTRRGDVVELSGGVSLVVLDHCVDLCRTGHAGRPHTYERFPSGLTYTAIAEHALAVANLQPGQTVPALGRGYAAWSLPVAA